jgi:pimeloyl-ACP methyl ester carboxylesterase
MTPFGAAAGEAPDLWPLFDRLAKDRPLLLVRGERSDLLTPETAAAMRARAPGLGYVEVPRVGHAPMLTEPDARTALAGFLDRVP